MSAENENFANLPDMGSINSRGSMNIGSANLENTVVPNVPAINTAAASNTPANSPSLGEQLGQEPATLLNTNSVNQQPNSPPPPIEPEPMPENQGMPVPAPEPMPENQGMPASAPEPKGKKPMTEGQAKLQADRAETLRLMREEYRKVFGDDKKAPKAKVSNAARLTTVRVKQGQNAFMKALYDDYITRNQGKDMNKQRKTMKKNKGRNVPEARPAPIAPIAPPSLAPIASPRESRVFSPSKEGKADIQRQVEHLLHGVHKEAVEEATRRVRRLMKAAGASSTTIHHLSRMILRGKESHAAAFLKSACATHSPLTSPKTAKKRLLFANKKGKVSA